MNCMKQADRMKYMIEHSDHSDMARTAHSAYGDMALNCPFCTWRYNAGLPILHMAIWHRFSILFMALWRMIADQ